MKFTPAEWEILSHRLGASDALAGVLADSDSIPIAQTEACITTLLRTGRHAGALDSLSTMILCEAVEGSTFFADIDDAVALGHISRSKAYRYYRAAGTLGAKLGVRVCLH